MSQINVDRKSNKEKKTENEDQTIDNSTMESDKERNVKEDGEEINQYVVSC